jgi:ubiquitin-protein ligase
MASAALKRLQKDLTELSTDRMVGVGCEPSEDDMFTWYLNLLGMPGTPYDGVLIRVVLEFPQTYPQNPPKAFFVTPISYKEGAMTYDDKGRIEVCLNLFGNFGHVHTEWKNDSGGWSPACSIKTIILQLQAAMGDLFSNRPEDIAKARNHKQTDETGHDSSDPDKWWPPVYQLKPQKGPFDVLFEDTVQLVEAVQKLRLDDEFVCYATGKTLSEGAIFGYGVEINERGRISSPFEVISREAFDDGIRNGTTNRSFNYWLPIWISPEHYAKSKPYFRKLVAEVKERPNVVLLDRQADAHIAFSLLAALMNVAVVEVMKTVGLTANDKFINAYFSVFRMFKQLQEETTGLSEFAEAKIRQFVLQPETRSKQHVPDLGNWLLWLLLTKKKWLDVSGAFLQECDTRNVFWYIEDRAARHRDLKTIAPRQDRSRKVFEAVATSRKLVSFQVNFLRLTEEFDLSAPLPSDDLRQQIKRLYQEVEAQKSWKDYYQSLSLAAPSEEARTRELETALRLSAQRRYTRP